MQHLHVVLDAVIQLGQQQLLLRLGGFALADIDQHVDGADEFARLVAKRRRERQEWDHAAVGPFGQGLDAAHRPVFLQRDRHRALIVGQPFALERVQAPGHAPFILADFRLAAGQFDRRRVVIGDLAVAVGRVHGGRQGLQDLAELLLFVLQ